MDCPAIVTHIEGDLALVEAASMGTACGRCNEAGGCASGLLGQTLRPKRMYRLPNHIGAAVGDRVVVCVAEGAVLRAALLAYLLPLSLLLAGAAIGTVLTHDDVVALAGAGIGLAAGLALLRWKQRRFSGSAGPGELLLTMRLERHTNTLV
jgi:sigma-E factor negative regulatory protein RseC